MAKKHKMDVALFVKKENDKFKLTQTSTQIWYLHVLKKHRIWTERSGFSWKDKSTTAK